MITLITITTSRQQPNYDFMRLIAVENSLKMYFISKSLKICYFFRYMEQLEEVVLKGNKIKDASNIGRSMRVIKPLKVGKSQRVFFNLPQSSKKPTRHGSYKWIIMPEKCGRLDITVFHIIWHLWQLKILELPAKYHCQSSPFTSKIWPNGLNWQWCLAGSSKTAPRILSFSIAIGAKPSF